MTPEQETLAGLATLVRSATARAPVPFVPEITLLTAAEPFGLWDQTGRDALPFWAFPWAGGQGLARYLLDHPAAVAGRHVLDVASGSGLVAIAAAKAGAAAVSAGDIDEHALAAIGLNAAANGVPQVTPRRLDLAAPGWDEAHQDARSAPVSPLPAVPTVPAALAVPDVVLAADVFYQRDLAATALRFLREARDGGADVLVADPGRAFVPAGSLTALLHYDIPVLTVLEDAPVKRVTIYRLR
jgi:predicted nicotinamide N-methyase